MPVARPEAPQNGHGEGERYLPDWIIRFWGKGVALPWYPLRTRQVVVIPEKIYMNEKWHDGAVCPAGKERDVFRLNQPSLLKDRCPSPVAGRLCVFRVWKKKKNEGSGMADFESYCMHPRFLIVSEGAVGRLRISTPGPSR